MDEKELYFHKLITNSHMKYTYFKLTACGAGIALVVKQTQESIIKLSLIPLLFSVILWGTSFFFGCKYIEYYNSFLHNNVDYLKILEGKHPLTKKYNDKEKKAAMEGIEEAIKIKGKKMYNYARNQFYFLISGAISYIIWHVLKMILRS
ncbi:MAG: hypothetical protein FXF54_00235 [Kosmotoga sp.]|nr:MAG: hypothetical protein FXF54_00235 [Kosmotoga sp.]